jgi:hypothetical protein
MHQHHTGRLPYTARQPDGQLTDTFRPGSAPARFKPRHARLGTRQQVNKIIARVAAPKIGVITTGKAYLDVAGLRRTLIDESCNDLGLRVFRFCVADRPSELAEFAQGLDLIIVVGAAFADRVQVREELYARPISRSASAKDEWAIGCSRQRCRPQ